MTVLDALVLWDIPLARDCAEKHLLLVQKEYQNALETTRMLAFWMQKKPFPNNGMMIGQSEAAQMLGLTKDVLRNWERNGLIQVPRIGANRKRYYGENELARLRIIDMLRQSNFSIAAILRSLTLHDNGDSGALEALNTPIPDEEICYVDIGDHWLEVLEQNIQTAKHMIVIVGENKIN